MTRLIRRFTLLAAALAVAVPAVAASPPPPVEAAQELVGGNAYSHMSWRCRYWPERIECSFGFQDGQYGPKLDEQPIFLYYRQKRSVVHHSREDSQGRRYVYKAPTSVMGWCEDGNPQPCLSFTGNKSYTFTLPTKVDACRVDYGNRPPSDYFSSPIGVCDNRIIERHTGWEVSFWVDRCFSQCPPVHRMTLPTYSKLKGRDGAHLYGDVYSTGGTQRNPHHGKL